MSGSQTAEAIAREAHAGQIDKNGHPYVEHLERVVAILMRRFPDASPAEIEAAWLHDVAEDTSRTTEGLLAAGISPEAVQIVSLLTRPYSTSYLAWIEQLAGTHHVGAIRVKLADNEDNSDPARQETDADRQRVERRYGPARVLLEAALETASAPAPRA